jgi:hypothetical protein
MTERLGQWQKQQKRPLNDASENIETALKNGPVAFEAYVGEVKKLSEIFLATMKEAFWPLQARSRALFRFPQDSSIRDIPL